MKNLHCGNHTSMPGYCISEQRDRIHVLFEALALASLPLWYRVAQQIGPGPMQTFVYAFMVATVLVDGGLLWQRLH